MLTAIHPTDLSSILPFDYPFLWKEKAILLKAKTIWLFTCLIAFLVIFKTWAINRPNVKSKTLPNKCLSLLLLPR
jgi:hypothetical protein